jgi:hypothetical protein
MKRLLALLLAVLMSLSLMACSEETAELVLDIAIDVLEQSGGENGAASEAVTVPEADGETLQPPAEPEKAPEPEKQPELPPQKDEKPVIDEDGVYTTKEDVALYIHTYGRLPGNFITKKEAEKLGWPGGDLRPYAPGKCIGGDRFGNYEGLLPAKKGRTYTECDIDTLDASKRGAKRIVFSNDGLIYYTGNHYESFELLYGEE